MSKIKITKQELKKQKDSLNRFRRYLPTLQLKKRQLQSQILKINQEIEEKTRQENSFKQQIANWAGLFACDNPIPDVLALEKIKVKIENIAGVDLPLFEAVEFKEKNYSLAETPLWVDFGLEAVKEMIKLKAEKIVLQEAARALEAELRITTQRVNLFEKIKIPKARENIRVIQIYLGERSTSEVIRGKIAKAKIEEKIRASQAGS